MANNAIAAALNEVAVGPPIVIENLTMFPLVAPQGADRSSLLDYTVLDAALAAGAIEITEVSDHGRVPELSVVNRGAAPVLIVDGAELVGAKQDRVVNLSILVAAQSTLIIPVSCVEAGRWRARSRAFGSSPRTQYASGRARRVAQVSMSMVSRGDRLSDQADVWADLAEKSRRLQAFSPTAAMKSIFLDHASSIDRYAARCHPVDGQLGALFAVDDRIVALDLFDRPRTLACMLPKLVRSAAVDALDTRSPGRRAGGGPQWLDDVRADGASSGDRLETVARQFLAVTAAAPQYRAKALGLGEDVRLTAPHVAAAALCVDEHVIHLSAFAFQR